MSVPDGADRLVADFKPSPNGGHRHWRGQHQLTNCSHISVGQFGACVGRTDRAAVFPSAVGVVLSLGASEQMAWVYAGRVVAFMKNTQSCAQGSMRGFIHEAMNSYLAAIVVIHNAVSLAVCGAAPRPAVRWWQGKWKMLHYSYFDRWCGGFLRHTPASMGAEPRVLFSHLMAALFTVVRGFHSLIIRQKEAANFGL
jgi:hypothetical protein